MFLIIMFEVCGLCAKHTLIKPAASECSVQIQSVTAQSDLDVFNNCRTVTGGITIRDTTMTAITIPSSVQAIEGPLYVENNTRIASIQAESLVNITGETVFGNLSSLTTFDMPALKFVGDPQTEYGGIDFWELPMLETLSLPNLTEIAWLNVISSDPSGILNVEFPALAVSWAGALFQGITSLEIPSLRTVGLGTYTQGPLSFWDIQKFNSLSAPSLAEVGGLEVGSCPGLTSLSFPNLTFINGSLFISNDSGILDVAGFPLLKTVGTINITGLFTGASFPNLNQVNGDVYIQSSSGEFQCPIPGLESDVVGEGNTFSCGSISSTGDSNNNTCS